MTSRNQALADVFSELPFDVTAQEGEKVIYTLDLSADFGAGIS